LPIADLTAFVREHVPAESPKIASDSLVVLCFGLIEPRKGIRTLISAAPEIFRLVPNAVLLIVGKPLMDLRPIHDQLANLGLQEKVCLVPQYVTFAQMAGYFTAARLLVLPYENGWNSGVLASAFGFGKPVVATRVGGFDEVIEDGSTGLLVSPQNPRELAHAVVRLLNDDALYAHMTKNVRRAAKEISWDTIARVTEGRYSEVLGKGANCAVSQARQH
jgi:glycosyltransferase involved in cell wall biosynthesis